MKMLEASSSKAGGMLRHYSVTERRRYPYVSVQIRLACGSDFTVIGANFKCPKTYSFFLCIMTSLI